MNNAVRGICAISLIFSFAGCSGGSESGGESVASPADRPMQAAMASCIVLWVDEVGGASAVNSAALSELKDTSEFRLEECGSERIEDRGIGAGYVCNTDGCYADDGHGYAWTDAANGWACANDRPDLCDE